MNVYIFYARRGPLSFARTHTLSPSPAVPSPVSPSAPLPLLLLGATAAKALDLARSHLLANGLSK